MHLNLQTGVSEWCVRTCDNCKSYQYIYACAQALDCGNVGAVVTQYRQRCKIAYELFPGRYGEWAEGNLSDEDLDAVEREMSRWSAAEARQRLNFDSTLSTTADMLDSGCMVPNLAAPAVEWAATSSAQAEAVDVSPEGAEVAEEHLIPDRRTTRSRSETYLCANCQIMH